MAVDTSNQQSVVEPTNNAARAMSFSEQSVTDALERYAENMRPGKPTTDLEGSTQQTHLYRTLISILDRPGPEFMPLWTLVLKFAFDHKQDVFHPKYIYRFFSHLRMSTVEIRNFERLLNLISLTADPKSRALGLKQFDLKITLKYLAKPNIVQNVRAYYQMT